MGGDGVQVGSRYTVIPLLEDTLQEWGFLQDMTQVIRQESYQATLHPLPVGSRIMGGQGKKISQTWLGIVRGDSFRSTTGSTQSTLNDDIVGDTPGQQHLTNPKTWNTKNLGPRLENVVVRKGGHLSYTL
jgi:hypothetical protein